MKTIILSIFLIIIFCVYINDAQAQEISPLSTLQETDNRAISWFQAAKTYWGQSPNCPEGVELHTQQSWFIDFGYSVLAYANQPGCKLAFTNSRVLNYQEGCNVMIHEYGHLLGFNHNRSDETNVMYPYIQPSMYQAVCVKSVTPKVKFKKVTAKDFKKKGSKRVLREPKVAR